MKKMVWIGILLFLFGGAYGQKNKRELVYLNNGSIVKGQVVPFDDDRMVVRTSRDMLVLFKSDIDTITSGKLKQMVEKEGKPWFIKTAVGVLAGGSDNAKESPFSFDASLNFRVIPRFYAGLGAGVDLLEESYLPAFLNFEYHFRDSRFTPFVGFQGGYLFPLDGEVGMNGGYYFYDIMPYSSYWPYYPLQKLDNEGGFMFNPSIGFVSHINNNLGISLSFGYRYSQVTFNGDDNYELETNYNRLSVKLGIIFN